MWRDIPFQISVTITRGKFSWWDDALEFSMCMHTFKAMTHDLLKWLVSARRNLCSAKSTIGKNKVRELLEESLMGENLWTCVVFTYDFYQAQQVFKKGYGCARHLCVELEKGKGLVLEEEWKTSWLQIEESLPIGQRVDLL